MKDDVLIVTIVVILCSMFGIIGVSIGRQTMRRESISAGVAHYTVNPTNGATTFEFKKPL